MKQNESEDINFTHTRRSFILHGMTTGVLAHTGVNDRIRLALIGCGSRGRALLDTVRDSGEDAAITTVCDVWRVNREAMAHAVARVFGREPVQTSRYQEVLNRADIDAVLIATPDFTHPKILADAVEAGKDAYVEKPFAVTLEEARMAYDAVKRSGRVVQVGTQHRSEGAFIAVAQVIQQGVIGKVTRVSMEVHFQEPRWRREYQSVKPEDVDWEAFCFGGRIKGGFDARKLRQWQLFSDTSNGIPGLWMTHLIDLVAWYLQDPFPKSAMAMGGVYLWKDGRQTTDVFQAMLEYTDCLVSFAMSLTNAAGSRNLWFGTKGTLDANALRVSGEGSHDPNRVPQPYQLTIPSDIESHMANFLRCVRNRSTPRASVEAGYAHAVATCMAAVSLRTGRRTGYDPVKREMI